VCVCACVCSMCTCVRLPLHSGLSLQELLSLENSLNQFNNNYLIVDSLLQHTSQKLSSLVSTSGDKFLSASKRLTHCPDSRVQEAVKCSVER